MRSVQIVESMLLQDGQSFRITETKTEIGLDQEALLELINCDLITVTVVEGSYRMTAENLVKAKRAARLARDFDLAPEGLALALRLFDRIGALEHELAIGPKFA